MVDPTVLFWVAALSSSALAASWSVAWFFWWGIKQAAREDPERTLRRMLNPVSRAWNRAPMALILLPGRDAVVSCLCGECMAAGTEAAAIIGELAGRGDGGGAGIGELAADDGED